MAAEFVDDNKPDVTTIADMATNDTGLLPDGEGFGKHRAILRDGAGLVRYMTTGSPCTLPTTTQIELVDLEIRRKRAE